MTTLNNTARNHADPSDHDTLIQSWFNINFGHWQKQQLTMNRNWANVLCLLFDSLVQIWFFVSAPSTCSSEVASLKGHDNTRRQGYTFY